MSRRIMVAVAVVFLSATNASGDVLRPSGAFTIVRYG